MPRQSLGTFPVRFPCQTDTGDTGWHVDASFPGEDSREDDFLTWRVNVRSRGRALLMLFLFSEVGDQDAPTRIRVGSHLEVARMLAPAGEAGLRPGELDYGRTAGCDAVLATGPAGRCICATLFWSMPLRSIAEPIRDSWPNRRFSRLNT